MANINHTKSQTTSNNNSTRYANALKKNTKLNLHPHANQGIVLTNIPELHIEEYLLELTRIVRPEKILSISRISNKIYLFFTDKETTDVLIENSPYIFISNIKIDLHRFTDDTKKIILNNCLITIPNSLIEEKFHELGIQLTSKVNLLRINTQYDAFKHILGPRRQVYIIPDENKPLPESIIIQHGNRSHKIYLTDAEKEQNAPQPQINQTQQASLSKNNNQSVLSQQTPNINDTQSFFVLPSTNSLSVPTSQISTDHHSRHSENISQNIIETSKNLQTNISDFFKNVKDKSTPKQTNINYDFEPIFNVPKDKSTGNETTDRETSEQLQMSTLQTIPKLIIPKQANTHPTDLWASQLETESNYNSQEDDDSENESQKTIAFTKQFRTKRHLPDKQSTSSDESSQAKNKEKNQTKRQKSNPDLEKQLKKAKILIETNPEKYPISYTQLKDLLENSHGNKDKIGLALEYTQDTEKLIEMLHKIYPTLDDSKTKNRVTRLRKVLTSQNS